MPITRARLVSESLNLKGTPYIWGGKGEQMLNPEFLLWLRTGSKGSQPQRSIPSPGGFALDCSGAVGYAFAKCGNASLLWVYNTDNYWNSLTPVELPEPGDVALYGGTKADDVDHIEMVISVTPDSIVVGGSSGGDSRTLSLDEANRRRAAYKVKASHLYRPDFRGFRSVESLLLGQG